MRCKLCWYMLGINEMQDVKVYVGSNEMQEIVKRDYNLFSLIKINEKEQIFR